AETEVCNGIDDDCSGGADDAAGMDCVQGSPPRGCTTSCGTAGTQTCSTACRLGPCVAATETCNDCDDDGDGAVDDGLACRRGTSVACTTACGSVGARTCAADCTGFGSCVGTEVCNGCDDDGDGTRDDGVGVCPANAAEPCTTASGVAGMRTCAADCSGFGACIAGEVCNGLDDDGDGMPDDGFPCVRGRVQTCTTACGTTGSQTCGAMCTFPACAAGEVCGNACDDDGDGLRDELCNDLCASAVALTPASGGTTMGTTDGAAREVMDCQAATGTPGGEVWYSITVAVRSLVYFDTFGTTYDTTLSLRPACDGAQIACEDDDCGTLQEQLVAIVAPGTYFLAVQARRLPGVGPFNLRWQSFAVPDNGTPTRITGNGTVTGTTAGTASSWLSCDGTGVESFHYLTVCPSTTRTLTASTCASASTFDTVVSIANGAVVACDDDTCGLRSTAIGTVTGPGAYQVIVDSFSCCATNAYSLAISGL
ncbi:MAG: hypothetical protein IT379_32525, partial [Deltaproteobacteria bacterium]|nr:hypothetical protein [Deltaproteobacteria bacterium]